ncbi:unnamed protein product, partial [Owenia fusiformis]
TKEGDFVVSLMKELKAHLIKTLEQLHAKGVLTFIGQTNRNHTAIYPLGTVSIDDSTRRPNIHLRLGAPLCTVDVDLWFCVEGRTTKLGHHVMIPIDESETFKQDFWKEIVVERPNDDRYILTDPHKQLLCTLKLISHIYNMLVNKGELPQTIQTTCISSTSYLSTIALHHQKTCISDSVGECFTNIVNSESVKLLDECSANSFHVYTQDMFYPGRRIYSDKAYTI